MHHLCKEIPRNLYPTTPVTGPDLPYYNAIGVNVRFQLSVTVVGHWTILGRINRSSDSVHGSLQMINQCFHCTCVCVVCVCVCVCAYIHMYV